MRKLKPGLLPMALCALIAILLVKLAVMVGGSLSGREGLSPAPAEVAEQKPPQEAEMSMVSGVSIVTESFAAQPAAEKPVKAAKAQANQASESLTFMQQRENELRRKEEQLKEKEERLAKLEKEIEQKIKDLLVVQKEIQSYKTEKQDVQTNKVRSLAKIYGTMKPKDSAKLLENLDDKLVMSIISTMTPDEAAAILALIEVKKAAKISEALSGR